MYQNDLETLLRSRVPIIVVESRDETRVLDALKRACGRISASAPVSDARTRPEPQSASTPLFRWSVTDGLRRIDHDTGANQRSVADPAEVLKLIRSSPLAGVYVLLDFHPYLKDATVVRLLKDIAQEYDRCARNLVLLSAAIEIPTEIEHLCARCTATLPNADERRQIIDQVAHERLRTNPGTPIRVDAKVLQLFVENTSGLTALDVSNVARRAFFDHGTLMATDLPAVMKVKYELLNRGGILNYEHDCAHLTDVGGLARLKLWLEKRRVGFEGSVPNLDAPKGILLLGVQGCGKSLAARACAGAFETPLLRLDCGALFDKFVGESERKLRESVSAADSMEPCVLWIDEIEKGFAAGEADGGAARRVLAEFLTWLAEKRSRVFVVATANDIEVLPAELVRKGRFDEIFFVDLPDARTRAEILQIHASRRGIPLSAGELAQLAERSAQFSGAELEQAVVAALYTANAQRRSVDAQTIAKELAATRPLAVVMQEKVAALREWAKQRTVAAD